MTPQQQTELDKAIARAKSNHVSVIGQGHFRDFTCDRFFLVSSSSGSRPHIVRQSGNHLICDCAARVICSHRAAVHVALVDEAVRKQRQSNAVEAALEAESKKTVVAASSGDEADRQAAHERAPVARSNHAIDIWKH